MYNKLRRNFLILSVFSVLFPRSAAPEENKPLQCDALIARLNTKFYSDDTIKQKPLINKSNLDGYPAVNVIDISSGLILEGYIWCKKETNDVVWISTSFSLPNLGLPSKSEEAEAIIADVTCTLMKAEMRDCDAIVQTISKEALQAEKDMNVKIHMAPDDWTFTGYKSDRDITFDFQPGIKSGVVPHEIDLKK